MITGGIVLLGESAEAFKKLTDEQAGKLVKALITHADGEDPDITDPIVALIYPFIRGQVDRMAEIRERKSRAGAMGGRPAKAEEKQKESTDKAEKKQSESPKPKPKPIPIPNHTETNTNTDTETNTESEEKERELKLPKESARKTADQFEEAWEAYPRKQGRKEAEAAYRRAVRDGTTHDQIMNGIEAYKRYLQANKIQPEYVKQGSSFFRQNAWNDDWGTGKKKDPSRDYDNVAWDLFVQSIKNDDALRRAAL